MNIYFEVLCFNLKNFFEIIVLYNYVFDLFKYFTSEKILNLKTFSLQVFKKTLGLQKDVLCCFPFVILLSTLRSTGNPTPPPTHIPEKHWLWETVRKGRFRGELRN